MADSRCKGHHALWLAAALLPPACTIAYVPCPLDLGAPLPADAFERCAAVLRSSYGALVEADPAAFRLQTDWSPITEDPSERRASVYREAGHDHSLSIVVERRRLTIPMGGRPHWTTSRGDAAAERELAELLRNALGFASTTNVSPQ